MNKPPRRPNQGGQPGQRPGPAHQHQSPQSNQQRKDIERKIKTTEDDDTSLPETIAFLLSIALLVVTFPVSILLCIIIMKEYTRAVVFRLGRLRQGGARGPGVVFILPCIDNFAAVDLRLTSFNVPPQEIMTKDSVSIKVDAVVFYHIMDPLDAIIQVANVQESTRLLAQTTLRNIVGTQMLMELLTSKDKLSKQIGEILDLATERWGVKVERVEIKDVRLPISLQRALAAEAEATREARAKIVSAEGELNASQALKEASDIMKENTITLQLRYLQTLTAIATERNATIIFPFPIDMMTVA